MIKTYLKKYFVTAMGAMAQGLFATLLIGTIISTLGKYTGLAFLAEISSFASAATGMAIGVAIGGFKLGETLYEKVPSVQEFSDWIVSFLGDIFTGQTIRYDLPFQLGIDATVEDILDTSGLGDIITNIDDLLGNPNSVKDIVVNVKGNIDEKAQQIKDWFADKTTEVKEFISNLKGKKLLRM